MKKIIYSAFIFFSVLEVAFAQETQQASSERAAATSSQTAPAGKVGINVKDPQQTLDVEGTLRVKDVPEANVLEFEPLGWLETGSRDKQGKIIKIADERKSPITVARFIFHIKTANEDWVNGIDLKIPKDKYTVILLDYALLEENLDPVYMQVMGNALTKVAGHYTQNDRGPVFFSPNASERGEINLSTDAKRGNAKNDEGQLDTRENTNVVTSAPIIMVYPDSQGSNWRFYADYPSTTPVSFNFLDNGRATKKVLKNYQWDVSLLIIDKTLITRNSDVYEIETERNMGALNLRDSNGRELDPVTHLPIE